MPEYIEREALIEEINFQKSYSKSSFPKQSFVVGDVLACIYNAPAAEVMDISDVEAILERVVKRSERKGYWKHRKTWGEYVCSECSFEEKEPSNFCPTVAHEWTVMVDGISRKQFEWNLRASVP
jgi:nicotinic acid phosphoribosyltransferase